MVQKNEAGDTYDKVLIRIYRRNVTFLKLHIFIICRGKFSCDKKTMEWERVTIPGGP